MLLQVFAIMNILLHIDVLTRVNVPITLGHMTTQNKHCFADSYIIDHSFYMPYKFITAYFCIFTLIIIITMLKSIRSCAAHAKDYHVYE